jgi:hypothetical protein
MNVTVTFSVRGQSVAETQVQQALILTSHDHAILRYCIAKSDLENAASPNVLVQLPEEALKFNDGEYVKYESYTGANLPDNAALHLNTIEKARLPAQNDKRLFVLHAQSYDNGCAFDFVMNHGFTDGTSIFYIVDAFLSHLSGLLSGAAELSFESALSKHPMQGMRDLIAEVLQDPRVQEPEDFRLTDDYSVLLKFPKVTDTNVGRETNGCIRTHFMQLDAGASAAILANCRRHKVSFQSLLSGCAALSLMKLIHDTPGELDESKWAAPIVHMVPVNMRRYLAHDARESSSLAGAAIWKQPGFQSAATLADRAFWSDLIAGDIHAQLNACLNSASPLQFLHRLNEGKSFPATSVMASSVGNIAVLKPAYGTLVVDNVYLQAGFYSASMETYAAPAVPAALINSGAPGFVMLHAYSICGALHLSGSYYAYGTEYIKQYYDEVVRLLLRAGSVEAENPELKVGEVFTL